MPFRGGSRDQPAAFMAELTAVAEIVEEAIAKRERATSRRGISTGARGRRGRR